MKNRNAKIIPLNNLVFYLVAILLRVMPAGIEGLSRDRYAIRITGDLKCRHSNGGSILQI